MRCSVPAHLSARFARAQGRPRVGYRHEGVQSVRRRPPGLGAQRHHRAAHFLSAHKLRAVPFTGCSGLWASGLLGGRALLSLLP